MRLDSVCACTNSRYKPWSKEGKAIEEGMTLQEKIVSRIRSKVVIDPETGCHLYTGAKNQSGYGTIGYEVDGRKALTVVHKAIYEFANGPVPEGMQVCHECDVPNCVNEDHLWLGTPKQNMQDMIAKDRQATTRRRILVGDVLQEAIRLYHAGYSCDDLAAIYGMRLQSIAQSFRRHGVAMRPRGRYPKRFRPLDHLHDFMLTDANANNRSSDGPAQGVSQGDSGRGEARRGDPSGGEVHGVW